MAYNITDKDKENAAARDTAVKIKQENKLKKKLMPVYFLPLAREFQKTYSKTGAVPPLQEHHINLNNLLDKHYSNTADIFNTQIRDELGNPEDADEINNQIGFNQNLLKEKDIHVTSNSIASTTEQSLRDNITKILLAAAIAGVVLTNRQIAKKTAKEFKDASKARLDGISITQTQIAAEGGKHTEARILKKNNAFFPKINLKINDAIIDDKWISVLDSRTRKAHVEADLQTVSFGEPFTVWGEKLKYPGDTSLGATLKNTIKCRCTSVKTIKRKKK